MTDAFDGLIVQIGFVDLKRSIHRLSIQGKPMVLGGDFHQAGIQVPTGWLAPRCPNFILKVPAPNA